ncbi:hypothetical protein RHSIM_Rhsim01G0273700 [Rhododendron simsii]|uniref:SMP domain-containing protein n=1 Tax=Rhododendron simsii TaxID=118357 RepID=A0A834HE68_RHOSS|nr:hypothetical protein RHSIM_Rhsim01G0273700 [Rhododendron simsii]
MEDKMNQEQQRRGPMSSEQEQITYGDVFDVSGDLASQPIAPQDAATMQTAEQMALGKTQTGGGAAIMQSAAAVNERLGAVGHRDMTDVVRDQGVTVMETDVGARRIVVEAVGDQAVGQYSQPITVPTIIGQAMSPDPDILGSDPITIGEALEASALGAGGDKPVDLSDAAAIQAAERATGTILPGGIGAAAQSAATHNLRTLGDEDKTTISDVLEDATSKLPTDKPATREDAEGVISAEIRNNPLMAAHPGGVADSVAAAARLNVQ